MSIGGENLRKTQITQLADYDMDPALVDDMDEKQLEMWKTNVAGIVLHNRVCLFIAKKLRSYHDRGFVIIGSVVSTLMLVLYTAFSFGVVNLALYKVDQSFYAVSKTPTFFTFLYYSFSRLLNAQIPEIVPITPASQIASMVESFFALFLLGIFVSLVFTVKNQKAEEDLNAAIKNLNEESLKGERFIKATYKIDSIQEAMKALQHLKASLMGLIYKLTEMSE